MMEKKKQNAALLTRQNESENGNGKTGEMQQNENAKNGLESLIIPKIRVLITLLKALHF